MIRDLAFLLWPVVAAYATWRLARVADRFAPVRDRPREVEPLPQDLVAWAMAESEAWAQEENLSLARQKFAEYGDWNKVRAAVGIGRMP